MNRQASILFNIISSSNGGNSLALQSDFAQHSYYPRLVYTSLSRSIYATDGFQILGRQLADIARHADFFKRMDLVNTASRIMFALPIAGPLKSIAQHYQALYAKQKGDYEGARRLLEHVAEEAVPQYRARALQVIGATYHEQGNFDAALLFYLTAGRAAVDCDLSTLIESQRNIAIIRSIHGDHKQALEDIEKLLPLVRVIANRYPLLYYSFLNSLAVELGELGRINEAEAVCSIALASPFAAIYPEIAQTSDEIRAKRTAATPSVVAVSAAMAPVSSPRPARNLTPVRAINSDWLACLKICFQRSALPAVTSATTPSVLITPTILDRLIRSINPRSPPPHCLD